MSDSYGHFEDPFWIRAGGQIDLRTVATVERLSDGIRVTYDNGRTETVRMVFRTFRSETPLCPSDAFFDLLLQWHRYVRRQVQPGQIR